MQRPINAKSLDDALSDAVSKLLRKDTDAGQSLTEPAAKHNVAVVSFDIDHFKQVNDSYGHDYGDMVLYCFANRLEAGLLALREEHHGCSLVLGRAGGEEFRLILGGHVSVTGARTIAEKLRSTIADQVLPSEDEWESIPAERKPKALQLPHLAERKITTSVGVSSVASPRPKLDSRAVCSSLRREADAALYRAKAGGRNIVRFFPEIRDKHGTVLEHHKSTDVVVIDIGTQVNVGPGQEYLVFHPDFTGDQPFVHHDGRSRKTLGHYPRRPSGRIVVFEAQTEISFCTVAENSTPDVFSVGALLELIPIGSISHLIAPQSGARALDAVRLAHVDDFMASIKRAAEEERTVNVTACTLLNTSELEASRGAAFANKALAELFKALDREYPIAASISQTGPTMLAVLTESLPVQEQRRTAELILDVAERQCAGLARFGAGLYCPAPSEDDPSAGVFSPPHALDLARYAAAVVAMDGQERIEVFSTSTAVKILNEQRTQGRHKEAISDYQRLKEYGVEDALFENQGALCCLEASEPDTPKALAAIQRANELRPDYPIFIANLAVIEWASGHPLRAYDAYERIQVIDPQFVLPEVYLPTHALASFDKFRSDPASLSREAVEERLQAALAKGNMVTNAAVERALAEIAK